jgi:hypothetical protein
VGSTKVRVRDRGSSVRVGRHCGGDKWVRALARYRQWITRRICPARPFYGNLMTRIAEHEPTFEDVTGFIRVSGFRPKRYRAGPRLNAVLEFFTIGRLRPVVPLFVPHILDFPMHSHP